MTVEDVEKRIASFDVLIQLGERILPLVETDLVHAELGHMAEDKLHHDVLRAIADGTAENPRALATAALKTLDLKFSRYYA